MNVRIIFNDFLVISGIKLWTVDGQNPAIEIGNALKRKIGIPPLTLGAIMIASWTRRPLHMNYIIDPQQPGNPDSS